MAKRFAATAMLLVFVLGIVSACVVKQHVPPGQIKKQSAPGQQKKH